ncbi:MAG: undecaprenyl-diphosphate phosphatase [Christensenellales bacterium]|jgi:undecaprenyl-diphosphatase
MEFFEILKAAIIGIIQGVTEWLPISSTGHMILADEFIHLNVTDAFKEMFFVVIQLGSILAVVVLYFHKLNPFSPRKTPKQRSDTWTLWMKVLVAAIPAGIVGLLLDDWFNATFYNYVTVAVTLILYGILFLVLESRRRKPRIRTLDQLDYRTALLIGACQILALVPGTSRSGSTILGAVFLGTSRTVAAEFSFFLAIPIMFGASALKLVKFGLAFTGMEWAILITGMVVAFLVSVFAIRFLMNFVKRHTFKAFGYYRIVLGVLVLAYFFFLAH